MKNKEDFIKWLDKKIDLKESDLKLIDLFFEWLDENKENKSSFKLQKVQVDFMTRVDENFRTWIVRVHNNVQLKRNRNLIKGDAVIYKTTNDNGDELQGFMIISDFDFESDFAARALIGKSPYKHEDGIITYTYYSDYTPCFDSYALATEKEIKEFIKELKINNIEEYNFIKEYYLCKDQFEKYSKYFD